MVLETYSQGLLLALGRSGSACGPLAILAQPGLICLLIPYEQKY
jgi:hypothetical protein